MTPDWQRTAREVAATLRADAVERDRAGCPPVREVERLRRSGLLTLMVPAECGGAGEDLPAASTITRIVAAADASVGHLLGYHYLQLWRGELFDRPEVVRRLHRNTVRGQWFWAGVSNPQDADLRLTPVDGGFVVDGRKTFATGAMVADRLVVSATRTDTGKKVTFTVDARSHGIRYLDDWDNMGQRLTASGGVEFDHVAIGDQDVLGAHDAPGSVRLSLAALGFQLMLSQLYVGIAEGALAEAASYTRTRTRPWPHSTVDTAVADPYLLAGYGELVAGCEAARLLADEAAVALQRATELGPTVTAAERGTAAVAISSAKVVADRAVTEITSRLFEFTGARATSATFGLDRFWRNARTLTLHDPVTYKAREIGEHFLTGACPPCTGYS